MKRVLSTLAALALAASMTAATVPVATNITTDTTWTSDNIYVLDGLIYVTDGAILTIEPGTIVQGKPGNAADASALIIARGSKIYAIGTPNDPIIFTAEGDPLDGSGGFDEQTTGLWGGVVVLGDGLMNSGKTGEGTFPNIVDNIEGIEVQPLTEFGGTNNDSSQGIMRYCSFRFAGTILDPDNELNAITLGGVTNNTIFEFIETFAAKDDGLELFGGNVNTRYYVNGFGNDDGIDWDTGWNGYVQFMAIFGTSSASDGADHGGELDGTTTTGTLVPEYRGLGTVYNATIIGPGSNNLDAVDGGFEVSDDAGARFYNSVIMSYGAHGIEVKGDAEGGLTELQDGKPRVDFTNNVWWDIATGTGTASELASSAAAEILFTDAARLNEYENPVLRGISRTRNGGLDPRPSVFSPLLTNARAAVPDMPFFREVGYQGAFSPTTNWLQGWTALSQLGYLPETSEAADSATVNISTNTSISDTGNAVAGFVINGELPKGVLVRVVGPTLGDFVAGVMDDPQFKLVRVVNGVEVEVAVVDDWASGSDAASTAAITKYVGGFALNGSDTTSAAKYFVLEPGIYTVDASSADGAGGRVIIEVYDVDAVVR